MTLGELFIKIGFQTDNDQLKTIQSKVSSAVGAVQSRVGLFKKAGVAMADGLKSAAGGVSGFFSSISKMSNKLGNFVADIKAIHVQIVGLATAMFMVTKKASDYAAELLRINSVTGISTQAIQALQQSAAASGVEFDEVNQALKNIQQQALDISMGKGNLQAWAMLGIDPSQDPIAVLDKLRFKLKSMSPQMGAKWAGELGLSDKMISFLKEAQSLGASDRSLLLSDKEIKKLKEFNLFFNRVWDNSKRGLQQLGVTMIPLANQIVNAFERMVKAAKNIGDFFEWFSNNFKTITKALIMFAAVIGITLFPLTAGFLALGLAIEDVMTWFRGGDSITGRIIGPFKEWKGLIDDIVQSLKSLERGIQELTTVEGWKNLFTGIGITAKESFSGVKDMKPLGASNADKYAAEDAKKGSFWEQLMGKAPKNDVTINVNGAGDPGQVAKKVVDEMNSNTMYQQPVGVK